MVGVGLVICRRGFIDPRVLKASSRIAFVRTHDGIHMNSFAAAEALWTRWGKNAAQPFPAAKLFSMCLTSCKDLNRFKGIKKNEKKSNKKIQDVLVQSLQAALILKLIFCIDWKTLMSFCVNGMGKKKKGIFSITAI